MGIELPVELTEVAAKAGVSWPKADEDAMSASATAWRDAGDKIKSLGTSSDGAATRALDGLTGATGDAARGRWAKVVAPDGELQRAARGCHAAADRLDHAARQVGAAKVEIVRELVTLAKNNDAAQASASTGNPNALLGLDTLTRGAAANVANLHNTLSSAIRLDSGVDMSHGSQPVNTAPGAHGPGGGGGLLSPVTDIVGGVVAPVAGAVAPIVEPVAAVVAPVTEAVAPVVGAVTAPVAPVVGAVTAPVAPVVGAVTDAAAPVVDAAAPVTAPAAAVVQPILDATPGVRDAAGPVFGAVDGPGEGNGRGEGRPQVPPGLVAEVGQAIPHVAGPVVAPVADVIPSVQGTLGPIAEGTTQASAAVLDQPLIRGEVPGQPAAAAQASAPAAPAAPTGPALGNAPAGGPMGGPAGGAVGGVASAAPAAASQVGAVAGQQGGAQAPGQQGQAPGQAARSDVKAPDAKAAESKVAEAKVAESKVGEAKAAGAPAAARTGVPGAVASAGQTGQLGNQPGQSQGQGQGGNQPSHQAQQGQAGGKDALAKDPAKDLAKEVLEAMKDGVPGASVSGDAGTRQVGETVVSAPAAPMAGVDLGGHQGGALTDRLDRVENREQPQALSGVAYDVARHTYTAAAAGSWFMAIFLSAGRPPRLAPKPARQLPAPVQEEQQTVPRFAPQDHPRADLVDTSFPQPAATTEGLGQDHPIVQELLAGYDPLAGMHERDWESLFVNEDGTSKWPVEREGGYEDSRPEILTEGAELDRFGTPEGRVLAKADTPYQERSLPPNAAEEGYRRYRVTRDLPVHRTISAPWFGQPGGGARYRTTYPVADLVALGYLTEITA